MITATINSRNEIVIPKEIREKNPALIAGNKVRVYALDDETLIIEPISNNLVRKTPKPKRGSTIKR